MTDIETIEVPKEPFVDHLVAHAREYGDYHDHVSPPGRGNERDVEWDWPDEWDVEVYDDEIVLYAHTEGEYKVQTARAVTSAPPSKCHPAEYERRTTEVSVEIAVSLVDVGLDFGEIVVTARGL
jgi:hypothetical protein